MKGCGRTRRCDSTVTAPSFIASSSADCVFGVARLISSASTTLANTGPGWNSKRSLPAWKTEIPITSAGSVSLVNWIRRKSSARLRPSARASVVLPTPGTSSMRTWPRASSAVSRRSTARGSPR